jgi:TPR repeat protein
MKLLYFKLAFVIILSHLCFCAIAASKTEPEDTALTAELHYLRIEAMTTHIKACEENNAKSCSVIGQMYFKGDGVKQDFKEAFIPLKKACEQGEIRSCTFLGLMYERGDGVPQHIEKAREIYQKDCHFGDPMSCRNLAELYEKQLEGAKAVTFYQKACEFGDHFACAALIRNYRFTDHFSDPNQKRQ